MTVSVGYLRDTVTGVRIDFQANPDDLPVASGASYAEKNIRGGSHPRQHYTGGTGRPGSITLIFLRTRADASDIEAVRRQLEALPFPDYDASGRLRRGPHPVAIVFGASRVLRVLVKKVSCTNPSGWFDAETTNAGALRCELEYVEVPATGDLSRDDVAGGA